MALKSQTTGHKEEPMDYGESSPAAMKMISVIITTMQGGTQMRILSSHIIIMIMI
jgi:hypothetical protein